MPTPICPRDTAQTVYKAHGPVHLQGHTAHTKASISWKAGTTLPPLGPLKQRLGHISSYDSQVASEAGRPFQRTSTLRDMVSPLRMSQCCRHPAGIKAVLG
jgi:hypothetical protein